MVKQLLECLEWDYKPGEEFMLRLKLPKMPMPEATRSHVRASVKEGLLAWRSLLDSAIEWLEETERPKAQGRTEIKVE